MANSQIDIKRLSFPTADAQLLLGLKGDKGDTGAKGDKGDTGDTGNGIASITHTGTSGAVKTYTITFTDGTSQTYDVTDGQVTTEQMDTAIDNAVTDVKSDLKYSQHGFEVTGWEKGVFAAGNGADYALDSYIRNQRLFSVSRGDVGFSLDSGYLAMVFAWDNGTYAGTLKTNGNIDLTMSNYAFVDSFSFTKYPNYDYKIAFRRNPESTSIVVSEGSHFHINESLGSAFDYVVGDLILNMADKSAEYISAIVNQKINFVATDLTTTYKEIINVKKGVTYTLSIKNSATPAFEGNIGSAITDENYIVKQRLNTVSSAGQTSVVSFKAEVDGLLHITVDKNCESISIVGDLAYNNRIVLDKTNAMLDAYIDSSKYFDGIEQTPTINATYYSGGIHDWGSNQKRIINCNTLSFPMMTRITTTSGYLAFLYAFDTPQSFTGDTTISATPVSSDWSNSINVPANTNILILVRTIENGDVQASDFFNIVTIEPYPSDLLNLTEFVDSLDNAVDCYVDGLEINVKKQGMNVSRLPFNPPVYDDATSQGIAIFDDKIIQLYSNGGVKIIDINSGAVLGTQNISAGHGSSASFANALENEGDEFPLLYVSDTSTTITVYEISTDSYTKKKVYEFPTSAGLYVVGCVDKTDGTLWCIGSDNTYNVGTKLILSHWNIADAQVNGNGNYVPTLINSTDLAWKKYLQAVQYCNGQIFALFGSDLTALEEDNSMIYVYDCETMECKSAIKDMPTHFVDGEIEGCDFVLNGDKYEMITSHRSLSAYYKIKFI